MIKLNLLVQKIKCIQLLEQVQYLLNIMYAFHLHSPIYKLHGQIHVSQMENYCRIKNELP